MNKRKGILMVCFVGWASCRSLKFMIVVLEFCLRKDLCVEHMTLRRRLKEGNV